MSSDISFVQKQFSKLSTKEQAREFLRCRSNPFYFIFNYVQIPETGGVMRYTSDKMHPKFKQTVRSVFKYHRGILLATRQLGKSSLAGCLLEWAGNFYPGLSANIINANKTYSQGNLSIIKYIHEGLPTGLKVPLKYKGERKTTIEYDHGSIIRTFYPSSNTSPDSLARSLTSPILYIDEAAHIRGMQQAYGAAYPTLSKAQEQAARNKYPYFVLITSRNYYWGIHIEMYDEKFR